MPTGYTSAVLEGATARQFAESCARAFIFEMRDAPSDAPLPTKVKGDYSLKHHREGLQEAKKRLANLKKMPIDRAASKARRDFDEARKHCEEGVQRDAENCFKLAKVLVEVARYVPPTKDLGKYKAFMIEQLETTIEHDGNPDYYMDQLAKLKLQSPQKWKAQQIKYAEREVEYHTKELAKAKSRCAKDNRWLKGLHASLKQF